MQTPAGAHIGEPERVLLARVGLHDDVDTSQRRRQARAEQGVPVKHDGTEPDELVDAPGDHRHEDDGRRAGGGVLDEVDNLRKARLAKEDDVVQGRPAGSLGGRVVPERT